MRLQRRLRLRHPALVRTHLRWKRWAAVFVGIFMAALVVVVSALEIFDLLPGRQGDAILVDGPGELFPRARRLSFWPNDYIIGKYDSKDKSDWGNGSYGNAPAARKVGIIVHIIVVCYMLVGLNTVCDIYFCGALDEMVESWKINEDVAGATFMAAGGSAPELFTSIIGAVVETDVGFGTIVGSAVFNVLAVIGCCGLAAETPIELTWWPLFRDCTYYILGLGLLAAFATGPIKEDEDGDKVGGGTISLWKAIVLFVAYIGYCVLMYFSERLENTVKSRIGRRGNSLSQVRPISESDLKDGKTELRTLGTKEEKPPTGDEFSTSNQPYQTAEVMPFKEPTKSLGASSALSAMRWDGMAIGDASERSANTEQLANHHKDRHSVHTWHASNTHRSKCTHHTDRGSARNHNMDRHYRRAEHHAHHHHHHYHAHEGYNRQNTGHTLHTERSQASTSLGLSMQNTDSVDKITDSKVAHQAESTCDLLSEESDIDDIEELLKVPDRSESMTEYVQWLICSPIYVCLYYGIPRPDRKDRCCFGNKSEPEKSKLYMLPCFCSSLLWIAFFSYWLVYCVEIFGEAILGGGDNVRIVLGFTLLAAGTSIPDMVSSVKVASDGKGDMAVSSSIGSNIFDILVGLPIPWIMKIGIIEGAIEGNSGYEVPISSPYIPLYVFLLLFMVFCVIVAIMASGWQLNKTLGACMAGLYVVFLGIVLPVELINKGPYIF